MFLLGCVSEPRALVDGKSTIRSCSSDVHQLADQEAFALLEVENNWEVWKEEGEWRLENPGKDTKEMVLQKRPLWTVSRKDGANRAIRLVEGWQPEGHKQFKALIGLVKDDRASDAGKQFELDLMAEQKEKRDDARNNRKRKASAVAPQVVEVGHELLDEWMEQSTTVTQVPV